MAKTRLLIVTDEEAALNICASTLCGMPDTEVILEDNSPRAIARLASERFDLLIADIGMPETGGIEFLRRARRHDSALLILMLTGSSTVETVAACMKLGATDYLIKPFIPNDLATTVRHLLQEKRLQVENRPLQLQMERASTFDEMVGQSPAMQEVFETIQRVAEADLDVLIIGETGTGKELVARSIHKRSRRSNARFVPVDCGAIPEQLLESEFFGHERGAFSGAYMQRLGLMEMADGGIFFLDEIGSMPTGLQAKLLRVLQERSFRRVGGKEEIAVDIRVIAASSRDLAAESRSQQFREELYYRLNVGHIVLPPLRQRVEDIPLLVAYFLERCAREMGKPAIAVRPEVMGVFTAYTWPGNVRELQNVLKRALAMSRRPILSLEDLPDEIVTHAEDRCVADHAGFFHLRAQYVADFERTYLTNLLRSHRGDTFQAAQEARIPRGTLYRLLRKHGLAAEDFRS